MDKPLFSVDKKKKIAQIAKDREIALIVAFGSMVGGSAHAHSDLDIAVLNEKRHYPTMDEFIDLQRDIQAVFKNQEVDLVFIQSADPLLLKKITEHMELLYGSPTDFFEFKCYAYKRYIDHQPYLEMERRFAIDYPGRIKRAAG